MHTHLHAYTHTYLYTYIGSSRCGNADTLGTSTEAISGKRVKATRLFDSWHPCILRQELQRLVYLKRVVTLVVFVLLVCVFVCVCV